MTKLLFVGVDGGASKCIVRVEDDAGNLLGQATGGPANIRLSVDQTWDSINSALQTILSSQQITLGNKEFIFHAGMGLAGTEDKIALQKFKKKPNHFSTLLVKSDAHTACLGAHGGKDGAIVAIGTGIVGYQIEHSKITKVGGWGFPHDDLGSGAWLGLQAMQLTLHWLDGREKQNSLTTAVYKYFEHNKDDLIAWVNHANSTEFAKLAPLVIQQSKEGCGIAIKIMKEAAGEIVKIIQALTAAQNRAGTLPCALVGGLAPSLLPYIEQKLSFKVTLPEFTPESGATCMVRNTVQVHKQTV